LISPHPHQAHQADLLFLPHDRVGRKTYKYALTVVDVASRYKAAEPLTSKESSQVAAALSRIYSRKPWRWPQLLQVDPGREFMGAVNQLLAQHHVEIRRGRVNNHRDQAIVERFNRTLSERLFGFQYAQEMRMPVGQRSTAWVARLPGVVSALNHEVTRLTGQKPQDAIRTRSVEVAPSAPAGRSVGEQETKIPSQLGLRYLYQPGELEGGRRRATDPVWSLKVFKAGRSVTKSDEPVLYYLASGPTRGFVREELLVVPPNTQLPPDGVLLR
jgi:transposase InsO family protein